jgi:hypothetical protein
MTLSNWNKNAKTSDRYYSGREFNPVPSKYMSDAFLLGLLVLSLLHNEVRSFAFETL